jgi:sarcosine oxidase subunit gamma
MADAHLPELSLTEAAPCGRFSLRVGPGGVAAAGRGWGVALPARICRFTTKADRAALRLGPDEWLLVTPHGEGERLVADVRAALEGQSCSLADVSDAYVAVEISGRRAAETLNAGCPLDLDPRAFPVGMCTRTLLAKVQVVLWRLEPLRFRIEVGRSFAGYASLFLNEAARSSGIDATGFAVAAA